MVDVDLNFRFQCKNKIYKILKVNSLNAVYEGRAIHARYYQRCARSIKNKHPLYEEMKKDSKYWKDFLMVVSDYNASYGKTGQLRVSGAAIPF